MVIKESKITEEMDNMKQNKAAGHLAALLTIFLTVILCFSLAACQGQEAEPSDTGISSEVQEPEEETTPAPAGQFEKEGC